MEGSGHDGGRGLRRNAIGRPGLVAESLGVTAPEISAVAIRDDSKGRAISRIGDEHNEVGPGSIMLIPSGVEHSIEPLGSEVVENIDVFAPARDDYLHLLRWMR